jgi:hypothetical protein
LQKSICPDAVEELCTLDIPCVEKMVLREIAQVPPYALYCNALPNPYEFEGSWHALKFRFEKTTDPAGET